MLSYELAKELKDAGFPQHPAGEFDTHDCGCPNIYYCSPTLSELIEACGFPLYLHANVNGHWYAKNGLASNAIEGGNKYGDGFATPEEAVARLWLALNKKP